MTRELFLFPGDDGAPMSWALVEGAGGRVRFGSADDKAPPRADRVVLVAPGSDVASHVVDLPAKSERQARAAAPFAVEDEIGQSLEEVVVTLAARNGDARRRAVAVVARDRLEAWRDEARALGLEPADIIPDYALTPAPAGAFGVLDLGDQVLARAGQTGFSVDAEHASVVIAAFLDARPDITQVHAWTDREEALLPPEASRALDRTIEPQPRDEALARLLSVGLAQGAPLRLDAQTSGGGLDIDWKRWRVTAAVAALTLVGYLAMLALETSSLREASREARAEGEALVLEAFPDIGRVVNPRAQLASRLQTAGGSGSLVFLDLSQLLAESVEEAGGIEVESVRFDEARPEVEAGLIYSAYADIERLREAVTARGGVLEEGGARQSGGRIAGDVVLRRPR